MDSSHSTRSIIIYGFLTVITILIVITTIGLVRIQNLTAGLDKIVKEHNVQIMLMHNMRQAARERSILLQSMMITRDPFLFDDYAMEMSRSAGKYYQSRQKLLQHRLSKTEQALLAKQNDQTTKTGRAQNHIIQLLNEGLRDEAEEELRNIALPGQSIAMGIMDEFITLKRQQNTNSLEKTSSDIDFTYGLMIALTLTGVAFSLGIAYFVNRRINTEIHSRVNSENNLRHSELRERTIRENIIDGVLTLDEKGSILSCNQACKTIFHCNPDEMIGKNAYMLLPDTFGERSPLNLTAQFSDWKDKVLAAGKEVTARRKDNSEFPAELDISRIELEGEITFVLVIRDITEKKAAEVRLREFNRELERKVTQRTEELAATNNKLRKEIHERIRAQEELTQLATHDSLTELPNRAFFTEQLATSLFHAQRRDQLLALLFLDLDGFKQVNDTYGHEAGDHLLIEVSRRLKASVRREDVVARMGGDEFTIILSELSQPSDAQMIADKIIHAISQPIDCGNRVCHAGISIGISYFPQHGTTADTLLRLADDAMYEAKAAGKNRFHIYQNNETSAQQ